MKFMKSSLRSLLVLSLVTGASLAYAASEGTVRATVSEQSSLYKSAQRSQKTIAQLADETNEALSKYRVANQRIGRLKIYNKTLQDRVDQQTSKIDNFDKELANIDSIREGINPLILDMIDGLEKMIAADMPFKVEDRTERVNELKVLMTNPDASIAEIYRNVMKAYINEVNYGRTIDSYEEEVEGQQVNMLRFGRVALVYQSRDGSNSGYWDKNSNSWQPLTEEYRRSIRDGLKLAAKQAAPSLLKLPIQTAAQ